MLIPMRDHNPSGKRPYVTYALLAANILIFISYYGLFANDTALMRFFMTWGMVPAALGAGFSFETLLTHQFLHGGILHLAFNMLFLWVYGDNMEEEWGHLRFLGFYLACGVAAGLAQYLSEPQSYIPMVWRFWRYCWRAGGIPAVLPPRAGRYAVVLAGLFPHYPDPRVVGAGRLVRDAGLRRAWPLG